MRQLLIYTARLEGGVTGSSVGWEDVDWQGGHGVVSIRTFDKISGNPTLGVNASVGVGHAQLPGFAILITESGVYPFWAPKGAKISGGLSANPGDEVFAHTIALYGDA